MTSIAEVRLRASPTSSPIVMPNAAAIFSATASVGLAWSRSIWLSIERLTPHVVDNRSNDQPRSFRNRLSRSAIESPGGSARR